MKKVVMATTTTGRKRKSPMASSGVAKKRKPRIEANLLEVWMHKQEPALYLGAIGYSPGFSKLRHVVLSAHERRWVYDRHPIQFYRERDLQPCTIPPALIPPPQLEKLIGWLNALSALRMQIKSYVEANPELLAVCKVPDMLRQLRFELPEHVHMAELLWPALLEAKCSSALRHYLPESFSIPFTESESDPWSLLEQEYQGLVIETSRTVLNSYLIPDLRNIALDYLRIY